MKVLKVTTDNVVSTVELKEPHWKSMGEEVGGHFERVNPRHLNKPYCFLCDDSGLLKDLPVNLVGSVMYGAQEHGQPIVGDIIFMREDIGPEGPDLFGLSDDDISYLLGTIAAIAERYVLATPHERGVTIDGKTNENNCPCCKQPVGEFTDEISKKEYAITGLCQACQDIVFAKPEDE